MRRVWIPTGLVAVLLAGLLTGCPDPETRVKRLDLAPEDAEPREARKPDPTSQEDTDPARQEAQEDREGVSGG